VPRQQKVSKKIRAFHNKLTKSEFGICNFPQRGFTLLAGFHSDELLSRVVHALTSQYPFSGFSFWQHPKLDLSWCGFSGPKWNEIRSTKPEIRNKSKIKMFKIQNKNSVIRYFQILFVLVIWISVIWICFGFRYSCFTISNFYPQWILNNICHYLDTKKSKNKIRFFFNSSRFNRFNEPSILYISL
jgi:hypothetical protein